MELHPLCTLFPRMSQTEFTTLRDDIAANGLLTPITTYEGMILDGGNRYKACLEAGVEPRYEEYEGGDIVQFVLSSNLNRRHLMPGQMAVIVAAAQDWSKAQVRGGDRGNQYKKVAKCNVAPCQPEDTVASRSALSGASVRTQKAADKVARENPELAKKVIAGEMTLPKALEQVTGKVRVRNDVKPKADPQPEQPETPPKPQPLPENYDALYGEGQIFSAFVLAHRAKTAIRQISKKDPNALAGVESIQVALNTCREAILSWTSKNEN